MKKTTENKIIVVYVGVAGIRSEDVPEYTYKVGKRVSPSTIDCEIITIPIQSYETRIECINPQYITDEELFIKHNKLMSDLAIELENQINILKENKNEEKN